MTTNKRPRILLNMVVENLRNREWEAIISKYPQRVAAAGGRNSPLSTLNQSRVPKLL